MLSLEPPAIISIKRQRLYGAIVSENWWQVKFPNSSIEINNTVVYFKNPVFLLSNSLYINVSHPHADTDGFISEKIRYFRMCYGNMSIRNSDGSPNVVALYNLANAMNGGNDRYYLPTDVTKNNTKEVIEAYERHKVCSVCKLDLKHQFYKSAEYTTNDKKTYRLCRHCLYGSFVNVTCVSGRKGAAYLRDVVDLHGPDSISIDDYNFSCDKPVQRHCIYSYFQ